MKEEVSDEEIKQLEEELKKLESKDTSYGSPTATEKDNLFKFFRNILTTEDTTRIGNLTGPELGLSKLGVRHYQELAAYAGVEGLDMVENYLMQKSQIITSTSMSRKGFWSQLFVTQIKREKKDSDKQPEKKGWWGKKQPEQEQAGE